MTGSQDGVRIRAYRPADHNACRRLWDELVEHRGDLYGQRDRMNAGAGFEEYLTRLDLSGLWVAQAEPGVVGFVGLTLDGSAGGPAGVVDPVVVTRRLRGRGIGRALLARVAAEARGRGLARLTISPSARDHAALRSLLAAGFGEVSSVTLAYALKGRSSGPEESLDLYDLRFHS